MLDDFDDIRIRDLILLERLVQLGTITAAAHELGIPKPTASRWLAQLEARVGRPLVIRGGRQVVLTQRGRAFHRQLQPLLAGVRSLRAAGREDAPEGTLRVSVPVPLGRLVGGSVIAAFRRLLPGVRLEVLLDNARVDLIRDRVDLAIRGGPMPDSSLVARQLARVPLWLYAPIRQADSTSLIAAPGDERLLQGHRPDLLPAAVVVDDRTAVRDALCAGAGIGILPAFLGEPSREAGLLTRLDGTPLSTVQVHAVFLPEQRRDARIRVLIELVDAELRSLLGAG
ncbi:MAG: DNA-binding transcriptional LysR family regulator [Myxococcota bacterium]|jgi:DNA-binding transcriptional LysR family regulator